jgi:SepF-like predicted cell division protein (DUF552 family)
VHENSIFIRTDNRIYEINKYSIDKSMGMGTVLDILLGKSDTLDSNKFQSLDYRNTELNPESALEVRTAEINNKSDLLEVENAVMGGNVVIADIGVLDSGLDKEKIGNFLASTVEDVDGDIVWKGENEMILTPRGVQIGRSSLA